MLSVRYNGKSVPDIVGYNLGDLIKKLMRVFAVVLLILVGVVFVAGPAGLLSQLTGMHSMLFVAIIFAYYFLATILPVDKIIGRIYPFFAVLLVFMAVGLLSALAFKGYTFYSNIEWTMHSPSCLPAVCGFALRHGGDGAYASGHVRGLYGAAHQYTVQLYSYFR